MLLIRWKINMIKKTIILCIICCFTYAEDEHKVQALEQLKSVFVSQVDTLTPISANPIALPSTLEISINNQWEFNIKSKTSITIARIAIAIDDTTVSNQVNIELQSNKTIHYFFSGLKLQEVMQSITNKDKFIGVYKQITADELVGFSNYRYKKLQVTLTWLENKIYNQSTINFMLVFCK